MKKLLAILLTVMLLGMTAASAMAEGTTEKYIKINVQLNGDVGSMNPWGPEGFNTMTVFPELYETLFFQRTLGGEVIPLLASGYTMENDQLVDVKLFENIYDSVGNHITANDVVFSYTQDIAEGNQPNYLGNIESIKALDDYTVQVALKSNGVGVFEDALCSIRIVSQAAYEKDRMDSVPVGTGPYTLKDWQAGSTITLVKNPNYWHADDRAAVSMANADEIVYKVISEPSQILIALENGEVDFSKTVSISDMHHFLEGGDQQANFNVVSMPATLSQCVFFNCSAGNPFADVRLRQAVSYAIDKQAVLDGAYEGLGSVCHAFGGEMAADYLEAWKSEPYYEYDVEKAKQLMKDAGYENGLTIRLLCDAQPAHLMMAQILQIYLQEIGITVTINSYDEALFNTYRFDPTQWDIHINNKAGNYVVQQWQYSLDSNFYKGTTCNWLDDAKLQELFHTALDKATHTPENVDAAWQYIKEVNPIFAVCFSFEYFVGKKTISEFYITDRMLPIAGAFTFADDFVSAN
ncbi:MAG: ABC transporter substrate-binding protein [Candidatus Limiplasma sp.]|nr:ABC transporter substrate-binding protein [Candidatus Limiplasma sp.]